MDLWITNRKSYVADRSVSVSMTLSVLEKRDATGSNFSGGSPIISGGSSIAALE